MKTARQWIIELNLSDKREKQWREESEKIWNRYRAEKLRKNNFNILWSNTETIAPAIYNTTPKPDVRRRFKDDDPLGKAVSETIERSLQFNVDCTPFDKSMTDAVLDMLIPGRGVVRVKYIPTIDKIPKDTKPENENIPSEEEQTGDYDEALEWEQAYPEHVKWNDFRMGPGNSWDELSWISFRHRMAKPEMRRLFGPKKADLVKLDEPQDNELKQRGDETIVENLRTAEIWEIWDKDEKKIVFISKTVRDEPMGEFEDSLDLDGFYPTPRPMHAINDSTSLIPIPLYIQYREQADELDRVSGRINKIIDALKVRGIYDSTLAELSELMRGQDNELIPAQSAAVMQEGGFDKAIWFLPIQQMAMVVKELYVQREQCKQVIYELTGISDIIRGTSNPNETLGAQQLKAQWGGQRLQKMQREVQRYARDLIQIMGQLICEKFEPETIKTMTQLPYPTDQEVKVKMAQMQQQFAMAVQQAQMQGQPPPQQPPLPPPPITWEQIFKVMKDDVQRAYRVDIETDSTIAANIQSDMEGLQQIMGALTQFFQGVTPLVQEGALPMEAVKQIAMQICRRSKMGSAVEDALDKLVPPQPKPDPQQAIEQAKLQAKQQSDQMKAQADHAIEQGKAQALMQVEQGKSQAQAQVEAAKAQAQVMMDQARMEHEAKLKYVEQEHEAKLDAVANAAKLDFERWKVEFQGAVALEQTRMTTQKTIDAETDKATVSATDTITSALGEHLKVLQDNQTQALGAVTEALHHVATATKAPRVAVRDKAGNLTSRVIEN